jgi:hypothetical protein
MKRKLKIGKLFSDEQISLSRSASGAISLFFEGRPPVTVWPAVTKCIDKADGTSVCVEFKVPREELKLDD